MVAGVRTTDVRWYEEVDSTNRVAMAMAAPGLCVVADHQTAGRGRFDRSWEAPPGSSLLVSVVIDDPLPTVTVALAAAGACEDVCGVAPALKWPNDLMASRRKLGGILIETRPEGAGSVAIVGIGINCRRAPRLGARLGRGIATLDELVRRPVSRNAVIGRVAREVLAALASWEKNAREGAA